MRRDLNGMLSLVDNARLLSRPASLRPAQALILQRLASRPRDEFRNPRVNNPTIAVIRGDGIGPEIMDATLHVLDACKAGLDYDFVEAGVAAYETLGELFRAAQKDSLEITIAEQIWLIITQIASKLSEILEIDTEVLMQKLFSENETLTKYLNFKNLPQAG